MSSVVWIDDEVDSFPHIETLITDLGARVYPCYTIADGLRRIALCQPTCLVLDAIVPLGDSELRSGIKDEAPHYTGRIVLERHQALRAKTVILSVVRASSIYRAFSTLGLVDNKDSARVFSKLALSGETLKEFRTIIKTFLGQD